MKIPKQFEMFGETISIEYDERLSNDDHLHGKAIVSNNKIILNGDKNRNTEMDIATFFHEFLHLAFNKLGEYELCGNEKLIQGLSGLIHQCLKTKKDKE